MAIKAKGFFGTAKSGFKLGSNKKLRSRFIRSKVNSNKNVKFAKKFFKSDRRLQRRFIRKKTNLLKRKAAEKALEAGQAVKNKFKKSITAKGFNPIKFITMIFVGWIVNQLPKIIATLTAWMKKLKPVFDTLKSWVKGILKFFKWIGNGVSKFVGSITGNNATVDAEKKKIEDANKKLKGTFKKSQDGFNKLEKKARGEEANLKKDMDNLDKEVNSEMKEKGLNPISSNPGAVVPENTTSTPKNKLASKPQRIGTGNPVTVVIKGESVVLQPGTVEYNAFFAPGGSKDKMIHNKVKDVNLVKSKSGPKILTVDIPVNNPPTTQSGGGLVIPKQNNPDSVNSKELMLTSMEK